MKKGVSLTEVLVLIVIIGILLALSIHAVNSAREAARKQQTEQKQKEAEEIKFKTALQQVVTKQADPVAPNEEKIKVRFDDSLNHTKITIFYNFPEEHKIDNTADLDEYKKKIEFLLSQLEIAWIFFENDLDKCLNNIEHRAKQGDYRAVRNLAISLSKEYIIPDGVIPKTIWQGE